MFTLYWIGFVPLRKLYPDSLSVHTQERLWWRDFWDTAKLRSAALEYRIIFLPYFGAVCTPIRPVAEVKNQERVLELTETEVNTVEPSCATTSHKRPPIQNTKTFPVKALQLEPLVNNHLL